MKPSRTLSVVAMALLALPAACGARSSLLDDETRGGEGGDPVDQPCEGPACTEITRGSFRLFGEDGAALGYLFLFDATGACNGDPVHYLLVLGEGDERCSRNSDLIVAGASPDALTASADNHGGSTSPRCGSDPWDEAMTLRLVREPCDASAFAVSIVNSEAGSPYTLEATGVRCRCDIGWEPCREPLPEDPCAATL